MKGVAWFVAKGIDIRVNGRDWKLLCCYIDFVHHLATDAGYPLSEQHPPTFSKKASCL